MLAILLAGCLSACGGSEVQSPAENSVASSVSGTVVSDETGAPMPDVGVVLEQCESGMMAQLQWRHTQWMQTDSEGRFHFEYMHQAMHSYRVAIDGAHDAQGRCYVGSGAESGVVLRMPSPNP
jgi:hypothetical protein